VAWVEVAHVGERHQFAEALRSVPGHRLEKTADMIADIEPAEYRPGEPRHRVVEDW
jgi:hypothetical protein